MGARFSGPPLLWEADCGQRSLQSFSPAPLLPALANQGHNQWPFPDLLALLFLFCPSGPLPLVSEGAETAPWH